MAAKSGLRGEELLLSILQRLKDLDPRIVPFDSEEVEDLELSVGQAVRDVFGENSPEDEDYGNFRISYGHISRGDSRADKQSKFEVGHAKAIERLEELLDLMDQHQGVEVIELSSEELMPVKPAAKKVTPPQKPAPAPTTSTPPAAETRAMPGKNPPIPSPQAATPVQQPKPAPRPVTEPPPRAAHPGTVLLLMEGEDDIALAVTSLLDKLGIDASLVERDREGSEMKEIAGLKGVAFAIDTVPLSARGGLSGLTSVMGKRPRQESIFKLGYLVGRLGSGRVAVLYGGERPQDIPTDLFGVHYIPYKAEGGWQIALVKLLKATGFSVDANVLLE